MSRCSFTAVPPARPWFSSVLLRTNSSQSADEARHTPARAPRKRRCVFLVAIFAKRHTRVLCYVGRLQTVSQRHGRRQALERVCHLFAMSSFPEPAHRMHQQARRVLTFLHASCTHTHGPGLDSALKRACLSLLGSISRVLLFAPRVVDWWSAWGIEFARFSGSGMEWVLDGHHTSRCTPDRVVHVHPLVGNARHGGLSFFEADDDEGEDQPTGRRKGIDISLRGCDEIRVSDPLTEVQTTSVQFCGAPNNHCGNGASSYNASWQTNPVECQQSESTIVVMFVERERDGRQQAHSSRACRVASSPGCHASQRRASRAINPRSTGTTRWR